LKKVRKSIPSKKIPEVDEIFDNVRKANTESDNNPESLLDEAYWKEDEVPGKATA